MGLFSSSPAAISSFLFYLLLVFCCFSVRSALGGVEFSSLRRTLEVSASPKEHQVLKAGEDKITLSWGLNQSSLLASGVDDGEYKKVKVRLCYAPVSQADRAWRKTDNDLSKDKTCQFGVTVQPYTRSGGSGGARKDFFEYTVERDVPTATYFVRAYVLDSGGREVAYGQTTDAGKKTNLFVIQGITGRHASLDIAAACFSAFSVVSLLVFFVMEKRGVKK